MSRKSDFERLSMTVFRREGRETFIARWTDPETGRRRERSLDSDKRRDAYEAAGDLAEKILSGVSPDDAEWLAFCSLYEVGHMDRKSAGHQQHWRTVKWSVEEFGVASLSRITAAWIVRWQQGLRDAGLAPNTVASYSTRLRAALRWAAKHDLLLRVPYIAVEVEEAPRARGITGEEVDRIVAAVPKVRPKDWRHWDRLLRGLTQCNLRIGELARLSWDESQPIHIDTRSRFPLIRMAAKSNKSRKTRIQPITPEFWAICSERPAEERAGPVFGVPNGRGGWMSTGRVIRWIGKIGQKAGVVTNPETRKTATSHDIGRRSFLPKVDSALSATEVHKWMGHAKFDTTLIFYDTRAAEDLAAKLWAAHAPSVIPGVTATAKASDRSQDGRTEET